MTPAELSDLRAKAEAALKLAVEALERITKAENVVTRSSIREYAAERLAEIRKITETHDGQA